MALHNLESAAIRTCRVW